MSALTHMHGHRMHEMCYVQALLLRSSLLALTPSVAAARARYLGEQYALGSNCRMQFDANALTFIVSSWSFPVGGWEAAAFGSDDSAADSDSAAAAAAAAAAPPCAYDHGALTPIATVIVPCPAAATATATTAGAGDVHGLSIGGWAVYNSGPEEDVRKFSALLLS